MNEFNLHPEAIDVVHNARKSFPKAYIDELEESITSKGLLNRLHVWKDKATNRFCLSAGECRLRAIKQMTKATYAKVFPEGIPVKDVGVENAFDARILGLIENIERKDLSSFEEAQEMFELSEMGDPKPTNKDLALRLNRSEAYVSRAIKTWKAATPELKKAWAKAEKGEPLIPYDTVKDIACLPAEEQVEAVNEQLVARSSGDKDARGKARNKAKEKAGKTRKPPRDERLSMEYLTFYFGQVDDASPKDDPHVAGFKEGLELSMGRIAVNDLSKPIQTYIKERQKAQVEKEKAAQKAKAEEDKTAKAEEDKTAKAKKPGKTKNGVTTTEPASEAF